MTHDIPTPDRVKTLWLTQQTEQAQAFVLKRRENAENDAGLVNAVTEADVVDALHAEFRHVALQGKSFSVKLRIGNVLARAIDLARARLSTEPVVPGSLDVRKIASRTPMPKWRCSVDRWSDVLVYLPEQQCIVL